MVSLSPTYASKHRQWPSPWLSSPSSQFVASPGFLQALSSPFSCRTIFSRDSNPRLCYCNSSGRSFVGFTPHSRRQVPLRAGSSDSTSSPAPPSDPPPPPPPSRDESISGALSRVQDTVQIFFAVFLWMALFFWASAWDGRNGGKHNKGNRFKR